MYRRAIVPIVAAVMLLAACGRQVTPSTTNGILSGTMRVRFATAATMDFSKYRYAIVFNTSGNGQEPYANAFTTSFLNYSFVWIVGSQGGSAVSPTLQQVYRNGNSLQNVYVSVPAQAVQLTLNSNGANSEFLLQFQRSLFYTVPPNASPSPGTTIAPTVQATTAAQQVWNINVFTLDANNNVVDAGGLGANDTSFALQVDTTQQVNNTLPFRKAGAQPVGDTAAQISGGEILNQP